MGPSRIAVQLTESRTPKMSRETIKLDDTSLELRARFEDGELRKTSVVSQDPSVSACLGSTRSSPKIHTLSSTPHLNHPAAMSIYSSVGPSCIDEHEGSDRQDMDSNTMHSEIELKWVRITRLRNG